MAFTFHSLCQTKKYLTFIQEKFKVSEKKFGVGIFVKTKAIVFRKDDISKNIFSECC